MVRTWYHEYLEWNGRTADKKENGRPTFHLGDFMVDGAKIEAIREEVEQIWRVGDGNVFKISSF